jgi:hypothetical protein
MSGASDDVAPAVYECTMEAARARTVTCVAPLTLLAAPGSVRRLPPTRSR